MRNLAPALFTLTILSTACGGSNTPPAAGAAGAAGSSSPTTTAATTGDGAGGAAGAPAGSASAGPTTTTTTTLGSNGDLSGSKLTTASSSTVQTNGSSGPTPEPHSPEPGRSVKDIQTIVMSHRDEARKCYDDNLKMYPGVEGDLDIKFTIDPKGNVTDAVPNDDKSSIHASGIATCVANVIKKIHFAESQKGFETRAHYPFNFHPKNGQGSNNGNANGSQNH